MKNRHRQSLQTRRVGELQEQRGKSNAALGNEDESKESKCSSNPRSQTNGTRARKRLEKILRARVHISINLSSIASLQEGLVRLVAL